MRIPIVQSLAASALLVPALLAAQQRGTATRPAGGSVSLRAPSAAALSAQGPDSFDVAFFTTKGRVTARIRRSWAPRGSDRLFHAVSARYYDQVRFYRVIPGFMAQFGFHGDPKVNSAWESHALKDDPVKMSNTRGMVSFANRGRDTRTTQLFINTNNNGPSLDGLGFAPLGSVTEGMAFVDSLFSGYGEGPPRGRGPDQGEMAEKGNAYLSKAFPKLDAIDSARVVTRWP
jgi:peptidyl-prolyl cis-trans isomerase A (cyclophilin A)